MVVRQGKELELKDNQTRMGWSSSGLMSVVATYLTCRCHHHYRVVVGTKRSSASDGAVVVPPQAAVVVVE